MNLGNNIKALRKEAGYTQVDLATAIGIKQSTVSRWEANIDEPSIHRLQQLRVILTCSWDQLLGS